MITLQDGTKMVSPDDNYFELTTKNDRKTWLECFASEQVWNFEYSNNDTVDDILSIDYDIIRIEDEISELEKKKKAMKENRQQLLFSIQELFQTKEYKTFLYWTFRNSPVLRSQINPIKLPYTSTCHRCEEKENLEIVLKSWAELDKESSGKNDTYRARINCSCVKKKKEEADRLYQEQVSQRCARLQELKTMPYGEYLQTEEWKETRRKALKRAQFKCQLCNSGGQLNVHHRTYERRGEEDYTDLIVLCKNCHSKHHDKIQE